jgi:hypothetical protein
VLVSGKELTVQQNHVDVRLENKRGSDVMSLIEGVGILQPFLLPVSSEWPLYEGAIFFISPSIDL